MECVRKRRGSKQGVAAGAQSPREDGTSLADILRCKCFVVTTKQILFLLLLHRVRQGQMTAVHGVKYGDRAHGEDSMRVNYSQRTL